MGRDDDRWNDKRQIRELEGILDDVTRVLAMWINRGTTVQRHELIDLRGRIFERRHDHGDA